MSWVYFLRPVGLDGPIKIGYSTMTETRIKPYFFWSPIPLELAAKLAGPPAWELRFHASFSADHSHHEWFKISDRLQRVIDDIVAGTFDIDGLEPGSPIKRARRQSPEALRSMSLTMRLRAAERRRVTIPRAIAEAAKRYANNPYHVGWGKTRDPADAALIEAFLNSAPRYPARAA